jgi:hypothetical protein
VLKPDSDSDESRLLYERGAGPIGLAIALGNGQSLSR